MGNLLTGLFAQASVAGFDGFSEIPGGWLDRNFIQLAYQLADSVAGIGYSFVVTTIILWAMHYIPGLRLRVSEETEIVGIDEIDMGEFAYDYVGIERELRPVVAAGFTSPEPGQHERNMEQHYLEGVESEKRSSGGR